MRAELTEAERAILDEMEAELFKPLPDEVPPVLYHYTTPHGFHEIVSKKEIWATHFKYLNDPLELRHGEEILFREAKVLREEYKPKTLERVFFDQFVADFPTKKVTE